MRKRINIITYLMVSIVFIGGCNINQDSENINSSKIKEPKMKNEAVKINDVENINLISEEEKDFNSLSDRLSKTEKALVGFWHQGRGVASGYSDRYQFFEDRSFKFYLSEYDVQDNIKVRSGKWYILDDKLYLRIDKIIENKSENKSDFVQSKLKEPTFHSCNIIFGYDEEYLHEYIKLGQDAFYKLEDNPENTHGCIYTVKNNMKENEVIINNKTFSICCELKLEDLQGLNKEELAYLRNAYYAKYGYKFKDRRYMEWFSHITWYAPKYDDVDKFLTERDIKNIQLILQLEGSLEKQIEE